MSRELENYPWVTDPSNLLGDACAKFLKTEHHSYKVKINSEGTQVPTEDATLSHQRQG